MDEKEYAEFVKSNSVDEWEYQKFCVSSAIALIAACWVLLPKAKEKSIAGQFLLWSICISILFLVLRGVRQFLNIRHNRKILDAESAAAENNAESHFPDARCEHTTWGRISVWLFPFEPLLQLLALLLFFIDASRILFD